MTYFKNCTLCNFTWMGRDSFLSDPNIKIVGYQADFSGNEDGFFLFNHNCGTTFSIPVNTFGDLYDGPKYKNILTNREQCEGHCLDEGDLSSCKAECKLAYWREIIQIIKNGI